MTQETFAKICALLKAASPGNAAPWDEELREGYKFFLKPIPEDVALRMIPLLMRERFRPPPGDLLDMAERIQFGRTSGVVEALEDAFDKRRRLGANCVQDGWYTPTAYNYQHPKGPRKEPCGPRVPRMVEGTPEFADPLTARVIGIMGGWGTFCAAPPERLEWMRREFEKLYHTLHGGAKGDILRHLHADYVQSVAVLPPPAAVMLKKQRRDSGETDEDDQELDAVSISRREASAIMGKIGSYLPRVDAMPMPHRECPAVPVQNLPREVAQSG